MLSETTLDAVRWAGSSEQSPVAISPGWDWSKIITVAGLALIATAIVAAYHHVLFAWLASDDYVHIGWLKQVDVHPELVLKNFYSNWLDIPSTKFYRPLISVSILLDHVIWQSNFFGYHVTNLLLEIANSILVFSVAKEVWRCGDASEKVADDGRTIAFGLLSAALFGLYPLHPEVVSWMIGRVDSIPTLFYLTSFWCYMRWRLTNGRGFVFASMASMILALMSKETGITIPAAMVVYELFIAPPEQGEKSIKRWLTRTPILIATKTYRFWLILAGYMLLRRCVLGTFIGGYDDTLTSLVPLSEQIKRWYSSATVLLCPFNRFLLQPSNFFVKLWLALADVFIPLLLFRFSSNGRSARQILFLVGWCAVSIAPVLRYMELGGGLAESRHVYLLSVPLTMLFALAFAGLPIAGTVPPKLRALNACVYGFGAALIVASIGITYKNNEAFHEAGLQANAIRNGLACILKQIPSSRLLVVSNLPDNYCGAPIARNAQGAFLGWSTHPAALVDDAREWHSKHQSADALCATWDSGTRTFVLSDSEQK